MSVKLTKDIIEEVYYQSLDQYIRPQDLKSITIFSEALFEKFKALSVKETVNNSLVEMVNAYVDSMKDYKNDSVILPENTFDRLNIMLHSLGIPLPANVKRQVTLKEPDTLKCNLDELSPTPDIKIDSSKELFLLASAVFGCCTLAGPGRGDCENTIGLPGLSVPGQHDGSDNTVDAHGKPNGWCWSCWKSQQIKDLQNTVQEYKQKVMLLEEQATTFKASVENLTLKKNAGENVKDFIAALNKKDLEGNEVYRMQIAGICTAATGYWKIGDSINEEYVTPALIDVAKLYARYDELYKLCEKHNLVGCHSADTNDEKKEELPTTITREYIDDIIAKSEYISYHLFPGTQHTICCIKMPNGATVIGESVTASVETFNEEDGRKYALEEVRQKIWSLEGYTLKDKRFRAGLK